MEEKIKLIEHLTKQIENQPLKPQQKNLVELLQNSPLFGIDLDLDRHQKIDHRQVKLLYSDNKVVYSISLESLFLHYS